MKKTSNFLSLNIRDFAKGLIVTVGASVVAVIKLSLIEGHLTFNWDAIGLVAIASAIAYLGKNLFTEATEVRPFAESSIGIPKPR